MSPTAARLRRRASRALWLLAVLMALPLSGRTDSDDPDGERKPAPEAEVELPAFPRTENLIPFTVSATTNNQFLIDSSSLSVGSDAVVRYTLVIVSPAGARNVSYEGMKCATGERRLYALGRADETWARARNDQWKRISNSTLNRHHAALFSEYFCPITVVQQTPEQMINTLRRGGHPALGVRP
ncbi:MAG TPA: CNP1-like family protein [Candidatus Accumulibacter phosphatis]|nr:CNP1-like family protein [Candidatus Accumulibacter phosphatis]HRQ95688.1 CNP1-like family protein [Candidatus Accumulibacter phosphatis]